jgi:RNA polymerase sigma factor (sigma-70 family)
LNDSPEHGGDVWATIEAVVQSDSGRIISGLIRLLGDFDAAEETYQEALQAAVEQWPRDGVPANPAAWLTTVSRRRAVDRIRRERREAAGQRALATLADSPAGTGEIDVQLLDDHDATSFDDDRLRLIFTCCHPALNPEAQVALTLRTLGGLTTEEIARAFLVPEPTIAQRIVRAKRTLAEEHVPFEVPRGEELAPRLSSVLEVIYLVFNEGYAATSGDDWMRPALCDDALRLGRILAELAPQEPEVHGLVALMEIQASRAAARVGPSGEMVLLLKQDRARWDQLLIRRGLNSLKRAEELGGAGGPYALQAAIAACHARALTAADTDWQRIAALYGALAQRTPSPVVELNRAVAVSMAFGPEAGLRIVDALTAEPSLANYHLLPAVRGDFLAKLGRADEARAALARAASMTKNARERALLLERAGRSQPS